MVDQPGIRRGKVGVDLFEVMRSFQRGKEMIAQVPRGEDEDISHAILRARPDAALRLPVEHDLAAGHARFQQAGARHAAERDLALNRFAQGEVDMAHGLVVSSAAGHPGCALSGEQLWVTSAECLPYSAGR